MAYLGCRAGDCCCDDVSEVNDKLLGLLVSMPLLLDHKACHHD